jgi:predicted porin
MKKTIVAAAIAAVVSAPAMADVKISGQINQEFKNGSGDLASGMNSDIVLSGSEDLGNGMKASFKIHRFYDDVGGPSAGGDGNEQRVADQTIGLSGDFGAVTVGRFEPFTVSSITSMANIDASEDLDLEVAPGDARTDGGFRYVSPNMNGLSVGVEAFADGTSTGDDFATSTIFATYSNAGLTVKAAQETAQNGSSADVKVSSLGVSYKMGDLEARVVHTSDDNGASADTDDTVYGVIYTMGANQIAVGTVDSDTANNEDTIISLKHSLSKSTSVYVVFENEGGAGETSTSLVGVKHTF